jgi:hypothetical protein
MKAVGEKIVSFLLELLQELFVLHCWPWWRKLLIPTFSRAIGLRKPFMLIDTKKKSVRLLLSIVQE